MAEYVFCLHGLLRDFHNTVCGCAGIFGAVGHFLSWQNQTLERDFSVCGLRAAGHGLCCICVDK